MLMPQEVFKAGLTLCFQFSAPPGSRLRNPRGNELPCIALEIEVAQ
jgi:hypothetical protein